MGQGLGLHTAVPWQTLQGVEGQGAKAREEALEGLLQCLG